MTKPWRQGEAHKGEMLEVRAKAHAWIDSLVVAGVTEGAAIAALHLALVERQLVNGGVASTLAWMRGNTGMVEIAGEQLLTELRKQGH